MTEDMAPEQPPQEPAKNEIPDDSQRFIVSVSHKGKTETLVCDALIVASMDFITGDTKAGCKGLKHGTVADDIRVILNLGQACVEVAASIAGKMADQAGMKIQMTQQGKISDNALIIPGKPPAGMDN